MDGKEDKASEQEHGGSLHSQPQRDGDSEEELSRGRDLRVLDLLPSTPPPEDTGDDLFSYNTSLTSSPVAAKRVSFSTLSSPRIGGPSLSPSSSRNFTNNSLKNMIPKPNFKNSRISNINEVDIEKAASLALASSGRDRSSWTLSNIFTPRTRRNKTESLPITPIVHSNPGSTHGRYVADPITSMKKGPPLAFHRPRSVPPFNKDGSLRRSGVFRVIPTPNMSPTRSLYRTNMKDTSVDGGEDLPEEEAVCRICLVELGEDSEAFKMECMCRGELALAHKECTIKWFSIKGNRTCDVCKQEVQNLPVTLLRMQDSQGEGAEASHYSIWQDVPVLVIVSMLAYFAFLEQLLLTKMKSSAIAISLPFSCILGLLASMISTTMVEKQYVWIYGTVQFSFIVCFSHVFFELIHMQPVVSILLATLVGFGLTMSGTTGLVEFLKWRRRERTAEPPSGSQEDPPPVQTDQRISVS